jgi:hypothetical protein
MRQLLTRGQRATILRPISFAAFPQIEGMGELIAPVLGIPNLWRCQFEGEPHTRVRFVHGGDWQRNPDQMIAALLDHYRASIDRSILTDFFPPNLEDTTI